MKGTVRIYALTPGDVKHSNDLSRWKEILYALAHENFDSPDLTEIDDALAVIGRDSFIQVFFTGSKPIGFCTYDRYMIDINSKLSRLFVFELICINSQHRTKSILYKSYRKYFYEALRHRIRNPRRWFVNDYVLMFCENPRVFATYSTSKSIPVVNKRPASRKLLDAYKTAVSFYCDKFNLPYAKPGEPTYHSSWQPKTAFSLSRNIRNERHSTNEKYQYYLETNPRWQQGYSIVLFLHFGLDNSFVAAYRVLASYFRKKILARSWLAKVNH